MLSKRAATPSGTWQGIFCVRRSASLCLQLFGAFIYMFHLYTYIDFDVEENGFASFEVTAGSDKILGG